jgi:hypothetical protein
MRSNDWTDFVSERGIDWIFCQVKGAIPFGADPSTFTVEEKIEILSRKCSSHELQSLVIDSRSSLIAENEFTWIERDNMRLLRWIYIQISELPPNDPPPQLYTNLIRFIDRFNADIDSKREKLQQLKLAWSDHLTYQKDLTWLREDNPDQINWAWKYIIAHPTNLIGRFGLQYYNPTNTRDTLIDIYSIFDRLGDSDSFHRLYANLKQAWSQQKYRNGLKSEKKKQSTYVIRETTKKQLAELAITQNVNINQMLEHIINAAYMEFKSGKK